MSSKVTFQLNSKSALTREECHKLIERKFQTIEFKMLNIQVSPFSATPNGFLGDHYRLTISVQMFDSTSLNAAFDVQFFVKCMPHHENEELNFVSKLGASRKEYGVLKTLIRDLIQSQYTYGDDNNSMLGGVQGYSTKGVDACDKKCSKKGDNILDLEKGESQWTSKCFLVRPDAIVLDDLSVYGYKCCSNSEPLDYQHATLTLQTVAKFHASSIIFEEKRTKMSGNRCRIDEMYPDLLFETIYVNDDGHPGKKIYMASFKAMKALLQYIPKYAADVKLLEIIKRKLDDVIMQTFEFVKVSKTTRNVVCHGDLWINNLLFRYEGGEPVGCRLVDLQMMRYTPPANDVMCFLHLTLSRELRDKHLEEFLECYYRTLEEELRKHDMDLDSLLPWREFRESCKSHHILGCITACYFMSFYAMKPQQVEELFKVPEKYCYYWLVDRDKHTLDSFLSDPTFRDRAISAMEELIDTFLIA